jgi:hypothetical protein
MCDRLLRHFECDIPIQPKRPTVNFGVEDLLRDELHRWWGYLYWYRQTAVGGRVSHNFSQSIVRLVKGRVLLLQVAISRLPLQEILLHVLHVSSDGFDNRNEMPLADPAALDLRFENRHARSRVGVGK